MNYYGLFLGFALLQLAACSSGPRLPELPKNGVVLAYGDSLTYGTGAAPDKSYPAILSTLIGRRVVNAGIPGEITAEGLARLPGVLEREKPSLVILCLGANDTLQRLDKKQILDNLKAMLGLIKQQGASAVLIAVPDIGISLTPPTLYAELAKEANIPCEQKMLAHIMGKTSLKSDLVHPNAEGYRFMAETLADLLRRKGAIR